MSDITGKLAKDLMDQLADAIAKDEAFGPCSCQDGGKCQFKDGSPLCMREWLHNCDKCGAGWDVPVSSCPVCGPSGFKCGPSSGESLTSVPVRERGALHIKAESAPQGEGIAVNQHSAISEGPAGVVNDGADIGPAVPVVPSTLWVLLWRDPLRAFVYLNEGHAISCRSAAEHVMGGPCIGGRAYPVNIKVPN